MYQTWSLTLGQAHIFNLFFIIGIQRDNLTNQVHLQLIKNLLIAFSYAFYIYIIG